jgi:hypothetical protein
VHAHLAVADERAGEARTGMTATGESAMHPIRDHVLFPDLYAAAEHAALARVPCNHNNRMPLVCRCRSYSTARRGSNHSTSSRRAVMDWGTGLFSMNWARQYWLKYASPERRGWFVIQDSKNESWIS